MALREAADLPDYAAGKDLVPASLSICMEPAAPSKARKVNARAGKRWLRHHPPLGPAGRFAGAPAMAMVRRPILGEAEVWANPILGDNGACPDARSDERSRGRYFRRSRRGTAGRTRTPPAHAIWRLHCCGLPGCGRRGRSVAGLALVAGPSGHGAARQYRRRHQPRPMHANLTPAGRTAAIGAFDARLRPRPRDIARWHVAQRGVKGRCRRPAGRGGAWDQVAADSAADPLLRDLATLMWAQRQIDQGDPVLLDGATQAARRAGQSVAPAGAGAARAAGAAPGPR